MVEDEIVQIDIDQSGEEEADDAAFFIWNEAQTGKPYLHVPNQLLRRVKGRTRLPRICFRNLMKGKIASLRPLLVQ